METWIRNNCLWLLAEAYQAFSKCDNGEKVEFLRQVRQAARWTLILD